MILARCLRVPALHYNSFRVRLPIQYTYQPKRGALTFRRLQHSNKDSDKTSGYSIVKPTVFTLAFVGVGVLLAEESVNSKRYREWKRKVTKDIPPYINAISVLIGLNVAVFGMWKFKSLSGIMNNYFLTHSAQRSVLPLVLSAFSHSEPLHLFANMLGLAFLSPAVLQQLGTERFLALYLSSGIIANYLPNILRMNTIPSLGASGCLTGVLAAFCILNPKAELTPIIFPFLAIPAPIFLQLFVVSEVAMWALWRGSVFNHAAHLTGAAVGFVYTQWLLSRHRGQRKASWI